VGQVTLYLHRSERADALADALASTLRSPLRDPLRSEVVAVPTRGVECWLAQHLSGALGAGGGGDGVCANLSFPFPARLVEAALVSQDEQQRAAWRPERLVWPLLDVVEDALDEPWLASRGAELVGDTRLGALRRIAELFDRYGTHRPEMVTAWSRGDDVDGSGQPLAPADKWQYLLWTRLRARLGVPSPVECLEVSRRRLLEDPSAVDLPERVSVFGVTRLPVSHVRVLDALADSRDVHLYLLHPSPQLWEAIAASTSRLLPSGAAPPGGPAAAAGVPLRRDDDTFELVVNPLLASCGRDAQEMQLVLGAHAAGAVDQHHCAPPPTRNLLGWLQAAIRENRRPDAEREQVAQGAHVEPTGPGPGAAAGPTGPSDGLAHRVIAADDHSISVHACHGKSRQAEVARDAILHALAEDPTLEPRDVVVMCPDIETFAPLVQAAFSSGSPCGPDPAAALGGVHGGDRPLRASQATTGPHDLRVRLADRSLRQTNPVLDVAASLLDLADSRVGASSVLDLAARPPVRARFGFDDDALDRMATWVASAGVRWGLDAEHRQRFDLATPDNTWTAGLDRILLGVALSEDTLPLVGNVLPLDDVGSGEIELAGRVAELLERLSATLAELAGPHPLTRWVDVLAAGVDALCATGDIDSWQVGELTGLLAGLVESAVGGDPGRTLTLAELRSLLAEQLLGRPARANFRTGDLTVCSLVPLRSVPHRVVCLLGIDDDAFPRRFDPRHDDLVQRAPRVGDRDPRHEDRQLWLDALLSATERLVITYQGRDPRTNATCPPAVPLGELLDTVDALARSGRKGPDGEEVPARERVLTFHPLQPFDPRNFTDGGCGLAGPWSFDETNRRGAVALTSPRQTGDGRFLRPLPPRPPGVVELSELLTFVRSPVAAFLRSRLEITRPPASGEVDDSVPVELDALALYGIGQRLLDARRRGHGWAALRSAERARQTLPPGPLGDALLAEVERNVDALLAATGELLPPGEGGPAPDRPGRDLPVAAELGDGWSLEGVVAGLRGATLVEVRYATLKAGDLLDAWVRLLALAVTHPGTAWDALVVGRPSGNGRGGEADGGGDGVEAVRISAPPPDRVPPGDGHAILQSVVGMFATGMCAPLPLPPRTARAWATARRGGEDPVPAAKREWEGKRIPGGSHGERDDWANSLIWGADAGLDQLLEERPEEAEGGTGWAADEDSRLGRLARRLWDPLLDHSGLMRSRSGRLVR